MQSSTVAVALALILLAAAPTAAQTGTVTASATVLLPPATAAGVRPLDFGELTAGVVGEVLPTDGLAGWFQLENVGKNKDVRLTFTLPTFLERAGGGSTMPAYFDGPYVQSCGNGCQLHTIDPTPLSADQVTAEVVHVRPRPFGANPRTVDVYLGGRVVPASQQTAGTYQGTIELLFAVL